MELGKKLEELKPHMLNCNAFSIYNYPESYTITELLCEFFKAINGCIELCNKTFDLAEWLVNEGLSIEVAKKLEEWLQDGTLGKLINEILLKEINDKLDKLELTVNNTYINVKAEGAKGDYTQDDSVFIQKCLDLGGNIYIPEGEYRVDKQLIIRSNTNLIMNKNAKLYNNIHQSQPSGLKGISILSNYDINDMFFGYTTKNITIIGGQLICVKDEIEKNKLLQLGDIGSEGISISHGENINISCVLVKDTFRAHAIELTGCKNSVVENCLIDGTILTDLDTVRVKEGIQIEHSAQGTSPSQQDLTLSKDIIIRNNIISKSNPQRNDFGSGIGSHNNDNTAPMENITIENNIIENCTHTGISYINYKNSKIVGNYIKGCSRGIGYYQARPMANVTIENNFIEDCEKSGIIIIDNSYNITLQNNKITNVKESGITGQNIVNLKVYDNRLLNCCLNGVTLSPILLYSLKDSIVENNYIDKTTTIPINYGVFLGDTESSPNKNVIQNNNIVSFDCIKSDIYVSSSAFKNKLVYSGNIPIVEDSTVNLTKNIYQYSAIILKVNTGIVENIIIPVSLGDNKVVITDVSNSSNNFNIIEFTLHISETGNSFIIKSPRLTTLNEGTQTTVNITNGYNMNIEEIRGV